MVRNYHWKLSCQPSEALPLLRQALATAGLSVPYLTDSQIQARSKTSWTKNRYSATLTGTITAAPGGSVVAWTVEMAGDKHDEIIGEVTVELPAGVLDDRGIAIATRQLDKADRRSLRRELVRLGELLSADERAIELARGVVGRKAALIALTNRRVLFLIAAQGLSRESIEQFHLAAIDRLSASPDRTGERLEIAAQDGDTVVKQLDDGRASAFVAAFREWKH
ncbi:MAG: hypothetical protein ABWZ02_08080 [Nakamurella sp.]